MTPEPQELRMPDHRTGFGRIGQRPFGQRTDGGARRDRACGVGLFCPPALAAGADPARDGRPDDRADRPRSLHIEPFVRQDGLCLGRGTARSGSRRDSGDGTHGIADSRRDAGAGGYDGRFVRQLFYFIGNFSFPIK